MRNTIATFATAGLLTVVSFGQTDRTFYFTSPVTQPEMEALATAIRTVVDLREISVDKVHQALVMQGQGETSVPAEWLFHHLNGPGGTSEPAEYKIFGDKLEVIAVIPLAPTASMADLGPVTTLVRMVADVQRTFPYEWRRAIVARDTPQKIAAAEWIVQQVLPRDGQIPTRNSPPYPMDPLRPERSGEPEEIRIIRMDPKCTEADLASMVTAIRAIADLERLFPVSAGRALIARAIPSQVAVAEWLVHELAATDDPAALHQTTMPGLIDGVVRLFHLPRQTRDIDVIALLTQIRIRTNIERLYPFSHPPAVVVRGRPDQMPAAEALVGKFAAEAH